MDLLERYLTELEAGCAQTVEKAELKFAESLKRHAAHVAKEKKKALKKKDKKAMAEIQKREKDNLISTTAGFNRTLAGIAKAFSQDEDCEKLCRSKMK